MGQEKKRTSRTKFYNTIKRWKETKEVKKVYWQKSMLKKIARQNPTFKAREIEHRRASKQEVREKTLLKQVKKNSSVLFNRTLERSQVY